MSNSKGILRTYNRLNVLKIAWENRDLGTRKLLALVRDCVKVKTTKEKEMKRMEANNTNNHVTTALLNKIQKEEETLSLLIQTEVFAEDSNEHYKMILLQQDVVGFYKAALAQVGTRTSLH